LPERRVDPTLQALSGKGVRRAERIGKGDREHAKKPNRARGRRKAGVAGEEGRRAMTLELFVMWVIVRLLAGWPTGFVVNGDGYGLIGDMALGLVGSLLGSWIFLALGVSVGAALVALVVVAFIGALLVIGAQRMLWYVHA
jgi:uncharacterized membrane protein YeaQ/YmgE (transglycosylase-associated protein family)